MKIDSELQALIPPLSDDEFDTLEQQILAEGIREPLIVWEEREILVDGHNRFAIADKHGMNFPVMHKSFADRMAVMVWMIDNQRGRRNLSKQAWLDLGFKRAELLKPRAEANLREGGRIGGEGGKPCQKSDKALDAVDTLQEAADYAGVSRDTAAKYNAVIREADEDTREAMRSGQISINKAYEQTKRPHVANNSGENEWYTPSQYIESARRVMGRIELDPASSDEANKTVKADRHFTKESNGLEQDWSGKVWMNPPYAQPLIADFCNLLDLSVTSGSVPEAIALVNNGTETAWFQTLLRTAKAVCFPKGRIKFIDMHGNPSGAPLQGQAILYWGPSPESFAAEFSHYGRVLYA